MGERSALHNGPFRLGPGGANSLRARSATATRSLAELAFRPSSAAQSPRATAPTVTRIPSAVGATRRQPLTPRSTETAMS